MLKQIASEARIVALHIVPKTVLHYVTEKQRCTIKRTLLSFEEESILNESMVDMLRASLSTSFPPALRSNS